MNFRQGPSCINLMNGSLHYLKMLSLILKLGGKKESYWGRGWMIWKRKGEIQGLNMWIWLGISWLILRINSLLKLMSWFRREKRRCLKLLKRRRLKIRLIWRGCGWGRRRLWLSLVRNCRGWRSIGGMFITIMKFRLLLSWWIVLDFIILRNV